MASKDALRELVHAGDFLQSSKSDLKQYERILGDKRVYVFKAQQAIDALVADAFVPHGQKAHSKKDTMSRDEARALLVRMMEEGLFVRVDRVPETKTVRLSPTRNWADDGFYAWTYEPAQPLMMLGSALLVVGPLALIMYPLWPPIMHRITWIIMLLLFSFIGFIIFLSIARLVVYVITQMVLFRGIWITPNLFADKGIIDSFLPLWDWDNPEDYVEDVVAEKSDGSTSPSKTVSETL